MKNLPASTKQSNPLTERQRVMLADMKRLAARHGELDAMTVAARVCALFYPNKEAVCEPLLHDLEVLTPMLDQWIDSERRNLAALIYAKYERRNWTTKSVLMTFAHFANLKDGLTAFPIEHVAHLVSCSTDRVRKCIARLEKDGMLDCVSPDVYRVNFDRLRADGIEAHA